MATIKKKIRPQFFKLVKSGKQKADFRVADFRIREGDQLVLEEWNSRARKYTGRRLAKKVKYVYHFRLNDFGQKKLIEKKGLYLIQF